MPSREYYSTTGFFDIKIILTNIIIIVRLYNDKKPSFTQYRLLRKSKFMAKLKLYQIAGRLGKNATDIAKDTGINRNTINALMKDSVDDVRI